MTGTIHLNGEQQAQQNTYLIRTSEVCSSEHQPGNRGYDDGRDEVERLREELNPKVKHMNDVLAQVKRVFAEKKKVLKDFYPQESWEKYGIHDKR